MRISASYKCSDCNGFGYYYYESDTCSTCNGRGTMSTNLDLSKNKGELQNFIFRLHGLMGLISELPENCIPKTVVIDQIKNFFPEVNED